MTSEDPSERDNFFRRDNPIVWGIAATLFVVGLGWYLGSLPTCRESAIGPTECESKFINFLSAKPNEVGDTLAGFAGALAFVWIIVTVWLQSRELAEQRKELALTRQEMGRSADALDRQAKFEQERNLRADQLRFDELTAQRVKQIVRDLDSFRNHEQTWAIASDQGRGQRKEELKFCAQITDEEHPKLVLEKQREHFHLLVEKLGNAVSGNGLDVKPFREDRYFVLVGHLESMVDSARKGTSACQEWPEVQDATQILDGLKAFLDEPNFWHERHREGRNQ